MEINKLSKKYQVRRLEKEDMDIIFELCRGNTLFYQYHPPFVTYESIAEDMRALPPGKTDADKYYIGFFEEGRLAALMDLILAYPDEQTAYIGLFMVDVALQGKGVGSVVIEDCIARLTELGYARIELAIDRGNPQSKAFWQKNGFVWKKEDQKREDAAYISMQRTL